MPPPPKDPKTRQRRNKNTSKATLTPRDPEAIEVPSLGPHRAWNVLTVAWWNDIWSSPMQPEWDPSDIHGLYILAELVDQFWWEPTTGLAAEIRLQRQNFGLTPLDRMRLQWEIERTEGAKRKRPPAPTPTAEDDPRLKLVGS